MMVMYNGLHEARPFLLSPVQAEHSTVSVIKLWLRAAHLTVSWFAVLWSVADMLKNTALTALPRGEDRTVYNL